MTGTANALPTAFFRLFCPVLVLLSGSTTFVQSVGKPNRLSASVGLITILFCVSAVAGFKHCAMFFSS